MGFLLVERILEIDPGQRASGQITVPDDVTLSWGLVAEAVGQLAAWAAMAKASFSKRPVAAIAGRARFDGTPPRGSCLDLTAELDSCDDSATTYAGTARVRDQTILEMSRCLGPMLPMEDFDDPSAVKRRFERLCAGDEPRAAVDGLGTRAVTPIDGEPRRTRRASFVIPSSAPFFSDHFPRKPVFPGTLMLEVMLGLARDLAAEAFGSAPGLPVIIRDVKLRRFLAPGDELELTATVKAFAADRARVGVVATRGKDRVASAQAELSVRAAR